MLTAKEIIDLYKMRPLLPEGGYIKEFYFSDITIQKECLPKRYTENKHLCGTILYLITEESFSRMHFLPTDEIYHFYMGDPVEQLQLLPDGSGRLITLGQDIVNGEQLQGIAPANCWHGTRLKQGGKYALLGTTMAPAYTDGDYIDGTEELIEKWPAFEQEIRKRL